MMTLQTVAVAITLDNGSLAVMRFLTRGRGNVLPTGATWVADTEGWWNREPSPANLEAEVRKTVDGQQKQPVSWRVVPDQAVPADRTYRGAWTDRNGAIVHDMAKAREIHRERIRVRRVEKLAALDVDYQRADEGGDPAAKQRIAAQKQILRDLPSHPAIDAAKTIGTLKAFWPDDLA